MLVFLPRYSFLFTTSVAAAPENWHWITCVLLSFAPKDHSFDAQHCFYWIPKAGEGDQTAPMGVMGKADWYILGGLFHIGCVGKTSSEQEGLLFGGRWWSAQGPSYHSTS